MGGSVQQDTFRWVAKTIIQNSRNPAARDMSIHVFYTTTALSLNPNCHKGIRMVKLNNEFELTGFVRQNSN